MVFLEEIEDEDREVFTISYAFNYKLEGTFAVQPSQAFATTMVLGTRASTNCAATRALLLGWEKYLSKTDIVRLRAANGKVMNTHGFVKLWIRVRSHIAQDKFRVCEQLPVPFILGAQFIDRTVPITRHEGQTVTLLEGSSASVVRQKTVSFTLCKTAVALFPIAVTLVGQKSVGNYQKNNDTA